MSNHTPGPWSVYLGRKVVANVRHTGMHGVTQELVCDATIGTYPIPDELRELAEANAALIAAAPDMKQVCEMAAMLDGVVRYLDDPSLQLLARTARAALAKTESR